MIIRFEPSFNRQLINVLESRSGEVLSLEGSSIGEILFNALDAQT